MARAWLLLLLCTVRLWAQGTLSGAGYLLRYPASLHLVRKGEVVDRTANGFKKVLHARDYSLIQHMVAAFFQGQPGTLPYMTLQVYPKPATLRDGNKFIYHLFDQASDIYPGWIARHWPVSVRFHGQDCWFGGYDANSPTLRIRVRLYAYLRGNTAYVFSLTDRQDHVRRDEGVFEAVVKSMRFQ